MAKVDYATLKKGGFMRQKQKNNFSLRLACVGGTLTAENLKKIAEVAEKYGDGYVHLTSRQGVEIPFIKLDDIDDVKDDLAKGGCKPGVCGPRVRTVTACQGNAVCPSGNINSYDIAVKLNERYFGRELPHKFKFGVTGCQNNCLKAEVAEKYGDGYVHLTSRQGVEIPFIKLDDIDDVKDDLAKGGCKPGVCGPRVRTVTACQGNAVCPSGNINSYDIAVKLNERYFGRELPHKFKFGVTGCQNNCLKAEENDVGIKGAAEVSWKEDACIHCGVCEKACRENAISFEDDKLVIDTEKCNYCGRCAKSCPVDAWDVNEAYIVSFGGTFGNHISKGQEFLPLITSEEQLFRVTDAAIQFFDDHANPGERFKFTIDRVGAEKLQEVLKGAYNG